MRQKLLTLLLWSIASALLVKEVGAQGGLTQARALRGGQNSKVLEERWTGIGVHTGRGAAGATILESLATWFSGLAYLNPRFGSGTRHPRQDWEDSIAPVVTAAEAHTVGVGNPASSDRRKKNNPVSKLGNPSTGDASGARARNSSQQGPSGKLPKVALMFLTRGDMPYEATWRRFLDGISLTGVQPCLYNADILQEGEGEPGWHRMFSLYVHPGKNYSYQPDSLFSGSAIDKRETVEWGQWSVMQAERNLMEAALQEELNERFVLLSESCVPLYPAPVVWAQLLIEPRSRIHACANHSDPGDDNRRMTFRMQNMERNGLQKDHWRKSGQWISLNRKHAQLVVSDTTISKLFKDECWVDSDHLAKGEPLWRFCVSDEHYTPSLLAYLGLDAETDCKGSVTNAWWDGPYFHPRTWESAEVSLELISKLRRTNNGFDPQSDLVCSSAEALKSARRMFPEKTSQSKGQRRDRRLAQQSSAEAATRDKWRELHTLLLPAEGDALPQTDSSSGRRPGPLPGEFEGSPTNDVPWMHLAVLHPDSVKWWELVQNGTHDEDEVATLLAEDMDPQWIVPAVGNRQLRQAQTLAAEERGSHWEAARQLLAMFSPMSDGSCPLFARKFSASGADSMADLAKRYTSLQQSLMRRIAYRRLTMQTDRI